MTASGQKQSSGARQVISVAECEADLIAWKADVGSPDNRAHSRCRPQHGQTSVKKCPISPYFLMKKKGGASFFDPPPFGYQPS